MQMENEWGEIKFFAMGECIFWDGSQRLASASPPSLRPFLSLPVSEWNFPAVWKSRPIVTTQPGVSQSIPLAGHATQTHKHTRINTRTYTHNCTHWRPASKACCVRWVAAEGVGGMEVPALVFVYSFSFTEMEAPHRASTKLFKW